MAVLRNGDADALAARVDHLRVLPAHPGNALLQVEIAVRPLGLPHVEVLLHFVGDKVRIGGIVLGLIGGIPVVLRDADDHGLAVDVPPQGVVLARLVEVVVKLLDGHARVAVGVEHDLGHPPALILILFQRVEQGRGGKLIQDRVGRVNAEIVDTGEREQLDVAVDHPGIRHAVVAVERLPAEVELVRAAERVGLRIFERGHALRRGEQNVDVVDIGLLVGVLSQPDRVEQAHVLGLGAVVIGRLQPPAQSVRGGKVHERIVVLAQLPRIGHTAVVRLGAVHASAGRTDARRCEHGPGQQNT